MAAGCVSLLVFGASAARAEVHFQWEGDSVVLERHGGREQRPGESDDPERFSRLLI